MPIMVNTEFTELNMPGYFLRITERLNRGKGEVFEEVDGDAIIGIGRPRGFQADHRPLGRKGGKVVEIHEWQGRGDGKREELAGPEGGVVIQMEKASREADIPDNPVALVQFTAFRVPGMITDRQRNNETIEAPSFQRREHSAPKMG